MAGIQNTKLKGLLAPRVIKQRGFLKQGLEWTLISSWLRQHLFLLMANTLQVNSTDLHGSTFSVFILRDIVSEEPNHTCAPPQIQSIRWKSESAVELGRGGGDRNFSRMPFNCINLRTLKPDFLVWTQTASLPVWTHTSFLTNLWVRPLVCKMGVTVVSI